MGLRYSVEAGGVVVLEKPEEHGGAEHSPDKHDFGC